MTYETASIDVNPASGRPDSFALAHELEQLTHVISHDVRAPLRAVEGFAKILVEDHAPQLSSEAQRYLQIILNSARLMDRQVDHVVLFARLLLKKIDFKQINSEAMVHRLIHELQAMPNSPILASTRITVHPLPPAYGDPNLVRQVWQHLISNALKFTATRSKPTIDIAAEAKDGEIIFSVHDNGIGFNPDYTDQLFRLFQRLHSAKEYPGEGVGLALAQRILERHGSRIWARSKVHEGACFFFTLPKPPEDLPRSLPEEA